MTDNKDSISKIAKSRLSLQQILAKNETKSGDIKKLLLPKV